jgi:UPF0755 protein
VSATRRRRPRFHPRQLVYVVGLVALALVGRDVFFPSGFARTREAATLFIRPGATIDEIARDLVQAGMLRSPFAFSILARATGTDRQLKAGQYTFHRGDSVLSILTTLVRGMSGQNLVTIPEGQTARDLAALFERRLGTDPEEFLAAVADSALRAEFECPGPTLEGYLFPDTYAFLPTTAARTIVRTMAGQARRILDEELARGGPIALEFTPHEILTLASIVEAEAMRAEERPRIAAVYLNRLRRNMLLQADPTVQYALGGHRPRIFYSDLRIESPYNTYRNPGLPPGPIGNPGRLSIQAVLNPTPGSRELFFVARGDGGHVFSESGEQHLAAVARVRGARAAALADSAGGSSQLAAPAGGDTSGASGAPGALPAPAPGAPEPAPPAPPAGEAPRQETSP